jgi:thioredoxin reductase
MEEDLDVIIIGGRVAGLSAALTTGRARRGVLVIDHSRPRNRFAAHTHGVLGCRHSDRRTVSLPIWGWPATTVQREASSPSTPTGKTSENRIWAVGNVTNPVANVPMAISAGARGNMALVDAEFDTADAAAVEPDPVTNHD